MDDSLLVRFLQRFGNLNRDLQRGLQRQRALAQPLAECFAVEQLHDQIVSPVLGADIVKMANVGMVER